MSSPGEILSHLILAVVAAAIAASVFAPPGRWIHAFRRPGVGEPLKSQNESSSSTREA